MTTYDDNNIFARILRQDIPCTPLYENDHVLAFADIAPQAPVHILVIPKGRYVSIEDFSARASDTEIISFWRAIPEIIAANHLSDQGFRIITNAGIHGAPDVPHFHVHILGGTPLGAILSSS